MPQQQPTQPAPRGAPGPGARIVWWTAALTGGVVLALIGVSQLLGRDAVERVFSESGFVERGSILLWLALAGGFLALMRPFSLSVGAGVVLCLFAAAREADLHKSVTGYSVLKPGFYLDPAHDLGQQVVAGALVAVVVLSFGLVCRRLFTQIRGLESPDVGWVWGLGLAVAVLVGSKLLDRAPAILRDDFGVAVPERALAAGKALEEGLESWLPMVFLGVAASFAAWRRRETTGDAKVTRSTPDPADHPPD